MCEVFLCFIYNDYPIKHHVSNIYTFNLYCLFMSTCVYLPSFVLEKGDVVQVCGQQQKTPNKCVSKVDKEGKIPICRHGFLLKGLKMFHAEIFAYPVYIYKNCLLHRLYSFLAPMWCENTSRICKGLCGVNIL